MRLAVIVLSLLFFLSCKDENGPLFRLKLPEDTGINFINSIEESDSLNIITFEYIYNGGGVAVADFNNDNLQDVLFTANMTDSKLYLNEGDLKFKDATHPANIKTHGKWATGVSVIDVNGDGWKDVYITASMKEDSLARENMLFINQGIDKNGIPSFKNEAHKYGVADNGYSTHSGFFDYDNDGDLDLYVLTNKLFKQSPNFYRPKIIDGTAKNTDRLYRNNGDGTFTNVSHEAGINIEGHGLGLAFSDINQDGWTDIYVSNDYLSNDILYINQGNGTFKDEVKKYLGHQSNFSMGNEIADVNNDGLQDIVTLDMLPETNLRQKTTIGDKNYTTYINDERFGYQHQYMRNMLHLNNGQLDSTTTIPFSDIGFLAGVHQTEWSWSPLLVDMDNDGDRDLMITNGFPKDITDKDFADFRAESSQLATPKQMLQVLPVVRVSNYAYENNTDLTFSDATKDWGLSRPSFSNGAAYADLDNDGDLDYIVNNINEPAFIYENMANDRLETENRNYLRIKLKGSDSNPSAIGAKITIKYANGEKQFHEHFLCRGYISSVEDEVHFGTGKVSKVDSILVEWPDGMQTVLTDINSGQTLALEYGKVNKIKSERGNLKSNHLFKDITKDLGIAYQHVEADKIDFNLQRTLPHKFSQNGPGTAVGDINGDHLDDFIIGGSSEQPITFFVQNQDGTFTELKQDWEKIVGEPQGLLLFDVENDGDLDLYIVHGSIESEPGSEAYQDRLFINDGGGRFSLDATALPELNASGSCVRAADVDKDGDLDLFVGGRTIPGSYPLPPESYLLMNDNGKFHNITDKRSDGIKNVGMVTDAIWTDVDNDESIDLIVVGEFMEISIFKNDGDRLVKLSDTGLENYTGWWNSIIGSDFDKDGDTDYVVGNLGLNNPYKASKDYPLKIYAGDFDGNGSIDPVLGCYMRESMNSEERRLYPVHFWNELNSQSTLFRQRFDSFQAYGSTTYDQLLNGLPQNQPFATEANTMATSYIENQGNGKFKITPMPMQAQVAPVNGMLPHDFNGDGNLDLLMVGNNYGTEVFTGNYDAFTGLWLKGDGKGGFMPVKSKDSGFIVTGDAKALALLHLNDGTPLILATQNKDAIKVFKPTNEISRTMDIGPFDSYALLEFKNGKTQKVEFYFGSGYLSQSSRKLAVPKDTKTITLFDANAAKR